MSLKKWMHGVGLVVTMMAAMGFMTGCDDGDDDSSTGSTGSAGSAVGTWEFTDVEAGTISWWVFSADGNFVRYDDQALTKPHFAGTYTQQGTKVTGTFVNGSVGDGEIDGTVSDDGKTMTLDFIEHWHDPYKHNAYTAVKL